MKKAVIGIVVLAGLVLAGVAIPFGTRSGRSGKPAQTGSLCTDLAGRTVRLPQTTDRIVLLRSKDIYLLAALLGEELPRKLIAWGPDLEIDDSELYKRLLARFPGLRDIAVTGSVYSDGLNVEQLLQLSPDLIIADKFILDRGYRYVEKLNTCGLPVVYLDGSSDPLTGPQKGIRLLGEILGKAPAAHMIAQYMDEQISRVVSRIERDAPPAPSVYLEAGHLGPGGYGQTYGKFGVDGRQSSWGAILKALRVRNVADGRVIGMAPIHPEALLQVDPDVIVITGQNWSRWKEPGSMQLGFNVTEDEARRRLKGFAGRPGWDVLSAVKKRKLYSVFHNTVSPTIFSGVQALAKYCYPDLFADLDPEENLRQFYRRFMPIPYDGTWMCSLIPMGNDSTRGE